MRKRWIVAPCLLFLLPGLAAPARAGVPVFEPPLLLEPHKRNLDTFWDDDPAAATDGSGNWVVAWSSDYPTVFDGIGGTDIQFVRSTDHGLSFSEPAPLNADAATDIFPFFDLYREMRDNVPSLAADATGTFMAVWHRGLPMGNGIEFSRSDDAGVTWSPNVLLSTYAFDPKIATDGAGTWIIVWVDRSISVTSPRIFLTRSADDGVTWSAQAPLDPQTDAVGPSLSWSGGVWVVTWTAGNSSADPNTVVTRSTDGGATWSPATVVQSLADGDSPYDQYPTVAGDGTGDWLLAWAKSAAVGATNSQSDIFVARSSDGAATWSSAVKLNSTSDSALHTSVRLAAGSPGTFVAVWTRSSLDAESSYGNDADAMTATSLDAGATWSPVQPLNDAATDGINDFDFGPVVAHDPAGHWLALWASNDRRLASGTKGTDMDIVMALGDQPCGNGVPDAGEQCDTGHRGDLDCCSRVCTFDAAATVCAADAELCTLERCDGAGTCNHLAAPAGTHCTPDSDLCTFDRCDSAANCEHVAEPHDDCRTPASGDSRLQMESDGTAEGSTIRWSWSGGDTTQRDIVTGIGTYDYALCLYDDTGLVTRLDAPNYLDCWDDGGKKPCWKYINGRGLRYSVRNGIPSGMTKLVVTAGARESGRITLRGGGANLAIPGLPITGFPLTVQLVNSSNVEACWEATYSTSPPENTANSFKASSD